MTYEFHFMTERNLILCSTKSHFMLYQSHFMLHQSHFMLEPTLLRTTEFRPLPPC